MAAGGLAAGRLAAGGLAAGGFLVHDEEAYYCGEGLTFKGSRKILDNTRFCCLERSR